MGEAMAHEMQAQCSTEVITHKCTDIDELYRQAFRMRPSFHAQLKTWASATGGVVHLAPQKNSERAVQKVVRSYAGDPSRLLDICRGALIFPDIETLRNAFGLIRRDTRWCVMRVKNRFDRKYDPSTSAG